MILIFFNYLVPDIFYYTGKGLQKKRNKKFKINHPSKNLEKLKMEMTELKKIMNENIKQFFIEMKNCKVTSNQQYLDMNQKTKSLKEDSKLFKDQTVVLQWSI
ncbi:unnamed protein product [Paramecium primaurelia]|uniref:Uncharacterized protein n=1 Tax=Paramecium primaurelia TaxID=5886 RepID=A0A8S1LKE9_PARPR|nr:unnamed protein product [Paramecium primaurelia]